MSNADHAAKAASLLRTLGAISRGEGPIGTTPQSKDLMSREALTESVLALNETLNRIFPAEQPAAERAQNASGGFTVWANAAAESTAIVMFADKDHYRVEQHDDSIERRAVNTAERYRNAGFRAVIVDAPSGERFAVRFEDERRMTVMPVRAERDIPLPSNDPADIPDGDLPGMWSHSDFTYGATDAAEDEARIKTERALKRQQIATIDLNADDNPCPPGIDPEHWNQIISAAVTARATGSVGARSVIPTSGGTFDYEVAFRKTVSDDQWKITSTTPVGDVYFYGVTASD